MYKHIIVPLDGSELAECVLPHAEAIARSFQSAIELVRVIDPVDIPTRGGIAITPEDLQQIRSYDKRDAESYLEKIASKLQQAGIKTQSMVLTGKAADTLANYISKNNPDLIIMASHGRSGISRWVMGSVADRILHSSSVPVLLVRAPGCAPDPKA